VLVEQVVLHQELIPLLGLALYLQLLPHLAAVKVIAVQMAITHLVLAAQVVVVVEVL
jgi:hypothetical protein